MARVVRGAQCSTALYAGGMSSATPHPAPGFALQTFAPGWGAVVMGTGVLAAVSQALAQASVAPAVTALAARVFLVLALLVAIPVLALLVAKWIRFPAAVSAELAHPIKGGMAATFPGAFLVLAVAIGRAGEWLFGQTVTPILVAVLTAVGGTLALIIGLLYLGGMFQRGALATPMITGAMFIPPVVTIIVPTALFPLLDGADPLARELLWVSWAFLGIGSLLYGVVVAALFFRTLTAPLPPAPVAPSLIIGMGPAGLIGLNVYLLAEAGARLGATGDSVVDIAIAVGMMFWGFGLWWGIAAVLVMYRGYDALPFALSWWGFTFPLGAWVVAGVVLAAAAGSAVVGAISLVGAVVLVAVWCLVLVRTLQGIYRGTIWEN